MPITHIDQGVYEFLRSAGARLLDVRTPLEYMAGHIPGSTNIPLRTIDDAELLIENKEAPLYVYCHSGIRSQEAADQLRELGYQNVKNIGGIAMYTGKIVV